MKVELKEPSPELLSLVNEWADSYIKSTDLPVKILEAAEAEGLSKGQIRKIVEEVLVKRGLSERRIREVLPTELKDQTKVHPKPAALSAAKPDKTKELEDELKRQKEIAQQKAEEAAEEKRQRLQLEEALHQTKQFVQANKLDDEGAKIEEEYKKEKAAEPTYDMSSVIWKTGIADTKIVIESITREIPKLRNRGWKTVEITMRAV